SRIGGVAAHEQAAPTTPCNAVNPGHRVFPIGLGIIREPEELVQVGIGHGLGVQPWSSHAAQLDLSLGDHTRQAQSSHRGDEPIRSLMWSALDDLAIGPNESEVLNVIAE